MSNGVFLVCICLAITGIYGHATEKPDPTTAPPSTTPTTHVGYLINLAVVGGLVICCGILLAITWRFRERIIVHQREVKTKRFKLSLTDKRFSFNFKRFSIASSSRMSLARNPNNSPANDGRNKRFMKGPINSYSNGQQRDSWDASRDSITGGPRDSWAYGNMVFPYAGTNPQVSRQPKLSTIGSEIGSDSGSDHQMLPGINVKGNSNCLTDV